MEAMKYKVFGMSCGGCARSVTRAVSDAVGGAEVEVDLKGGTVGVRGAHDPKVVEAAVRDAGFEFGGVA